MKKTISLISLILVLLVGWILISKNTPFNLKNATPTTENISIPDYGFAFSYDNEKLILVEQLEETRGDLVYRTTLFNKNEYAEFLGSSTPREGPTAISLEVFRNPMNQTPSEWIKNHPAANFAFSVPNSLHSETIGTTEYATYEWDGLYRARAYATDKNGYLYLFTVTYLTETDQLYTQMPTLLESLSWTTPVVPPQTAHGDIRVELPKTDEAITSPLTIKGSARGIWFFEASAPVSLTDWDGKIIAEGHITAQGEWMTENFVPFTGELTFTKPSYGERGTLILKKDNPSGLPEFDDAIEVPVRFK